jgi:hypothetical protein
LARTSIRVDWEQIANDVVAVLRAEAGRDPYDRALSDLASALDAVRDVLHAVGRARRPQARYG